MKTCVYCGQPAGTGRRELRPYGPNGTHVCIECVLNDPKKNDVARQRYAKMLNSADKVTGKALLTVDGPLPYIGTLKKI